MLDEFSTLERKRQKYLTSSFKDDDMLQLANQFEELGKNCESISDFQKAIECYRRSSYCHSILNNVPQYDNLCTRVDELNDLITQINIIHIVTSKNEAIKRNFDTLSERLDNDEEKEVIEENIKKLDTVNIQNISSASLHADIDNYKQIIQSNNDLIVRYQKQIIDLEETIYLNNNVLASNKEIIRVLQAKADDLSLLKEQVEKLTCEVEGLRSILQAQLSRVESKVDKIQQNIKEILPGIDYDKLLKSIEKLISTQEINQFILHNVEDQIKSIPKHTLSSFVDEFIKFNINIITTEEFENWWGTYTDICGFVYHSTSLPPTILDDIGNCIAGPNKKQDGKTLYLSGVGTMRDPYRYRVYVGDNDNSKFLGFPIKIYTHQNALYIKYGGQHNHDEVNLLILTLQSHEIVGEVSEF